MDSTAYRYFLDELCPAARRCSWVPSRFVQGDYQADAEAFAALGAFLAEVLGDTDQRPPSPLLARRASSPPSRRPLSELLRAVHEEILGRLTGTADSSATASKRRGTELFRLLVQAAHPRRVNLFEPGDAVAPATACFLIETCMHFGWCPNGRECHGKRAAHVYFVQCRKALRSPGASQLAAAFCYVWGAWLLARETEGIRDRFPPSEKQDSIEHYRWHDGERTVSCLVLNLLRNELYAVVPAHNTLLPSPFRSLACEGRTGSLAYLEGEPIVPTAIESFEMISRPKIDGAWWRYSCTTGKDRQSAWTVVVQVYGSTIYRSDVLKAQGKPGTLTRFETRIEVGPEARMVSPTLFAAASGDVTAVEPVANPFCLRPAGSGLPDIALFGGGPSPLPAERSVETAIAWRRGRGTVEIDRTHLLGIFDL